MKTLEEREGRALYERFFFDHHYDHYPRFRSLDDAELIFPVGGPHAVESDLLEDEEFAAFVAAARKVGDDSFVLYRLECPEGYSAFVETELDEAADVYYGELVLAHALLSPSGAWAFCGVADRAGLVTGSEEFMRAWRSHWPHDTERALFEFLEHVNHERNDWVPSLLKAVYGDDRARRYLVELR
jgi:hypothetical protein